MATFGETLKRERELRKISLREISEATKIGLRYLEAMEENRFDQLPGGVFNKGFIRAYARFIGLDEEALINSYLYDLSRLENPAPDRPRYMGAVSDEVPPAPVPVPDPEPKPRPRTGRLIAMSLGVVVLVGGCWWILSRGAGSFRSLSTSPAAPPQEASVSIPTARPRLPGPASASPGEGALSGTGSETPAASSVDPAPASESPEKGTDKPADHAARSLVLSISASETTWISVYCEGTEEVNRDLSQADSPLILECPGEMRLSTASAGALGLKVNGRDCLPLGERGVELREFVLNRENVPEICASKAKEP